MVDPQSDRADTIKKKVSITQGVRLVEKLILAWVNALNFSSFFKKAAENGFSLQMIFEQ